MRESLVSIKEKHFISFAILVFFTSCATAFSSPYMSLFLFQNTKANESQIGLYVTISAIANIVISFIIAYISDKLIDRKKMLYVTLMASLISYILFSGSNDFYFILIVSITIMAVGANVTSQVFAYAKQMLTEKINDDKIVSMMMTLLRSIISVSWSIGPLLASLILMKLNYSALFMIVSLIYFVSLFICMITFNSVNRKMIIPIKQMSNLQLLNHKTSFNYIIISMYFCVFVLAQMVSSLISNVFPIYITEILAYSESYIGIITSFTAIVEVPLMILMAILIKKYDITNLLSIGFISCFIFLVVFSTVKSINLLILCYVFRALFNATSIGLGIVFFSKYNP